VKRVKHNDNIYWEEDKDEGQGQGSMPDEKDIDED
jgi:hypothetical protein